MRKTKKVGLALVAALVIMMLGGCGAKFDASAYLQALLDNSYKNDSTQLVALEVATAEEAAEVYEQGLQVEMDTLTEGTELSEELQAEYRTLVQDLLKNAKYTVGEAQKQDDGSFAVTVKYQPMQVFGPAMEDFMAQSETYLAEMTTQMMDGGEEPTDEEINDKIYTMLKDSLKTAVAGAAFGEEAEMTIRISAVDNVYSPSEEDLGNLETALFDSDALENLE